MKLLFLFVALFCAASAFAAEKYQCLVTSAVVKNPGSSVITDATEQDPTLKGMVFFVDRSSGRITGSSLFDNADDQVEIVRDEKGVVDDFVITSKKNGDLRVLRITSHEGKRTFIFLVEALGVLMVGECKNA